jgi:glyoxylase-like metal-dependent hydrolase (beta-lactamase superfamily II)
VDPSLSPIEGPGLAAFTSGSLPPLERIDEQTVVFGQDMPKVGIVTSTLTYLLLGPDGAANIVDPGWDIPQNRARLTQVLDGLGITHVDTVVATHLHADHLGLAEFIRDTYAARIAISAIERQVIEAKSVDLARAASSRDWGGPPDAIVQPERERPTAPVMTPDVMLHDGDVIDLGRPVTVIASPGHTQGSICLADERYVLTGDTILPHINPGLSLGYLPGADPIADYLESGERLLGYAGWTVLPGHGYRFANLSARTRQLMDHHLGRSRHVRDVLAATPDASVYDIARQLTWTAGWENLRGHYRFSALQQTAHHVRFVHDTARSERWLRPGRRSS